MSVGRQPCQRVHVVADPGVPCTLVTEVMPRLSQVFASRVADDREWAIDMECVRIPADEQGRIHLSALAAEHSTTPQRLVVCITDQPRRDGTHPIAADIGLDPPIALLSIPALGGRRIRTRLTQLIAVVVGELIQLDDPRDRSVATLQRIAAEEPADVDIRLVGTGRHGRMRLLAGMIIANRPWRMIAHLSKAFAGAVATGAFVLLNPSLWNVSHSLDSVRLAVAAIIATAAMVVWIIGAHHMWERRADVSAPELALLYNATTATTVIVAVLTMYVALLALALLSQAVVVDSKLFSQTVGQAARFGERMKLVWLAASAATIGGALGTGFESDEAVRKAAYGYRQRERRRSQDRASGNDDGSGHLHDQQTPPGER